MSLLRDVTRGKGINNVQYVLMGLANLTRLEREITDNKCRYLPYEFGKPILIKFC